MYSLGHALNVATRDRSLNPSIASPRKRMDPGSSLTSLAMPRHLSNPTPYVFPTSITPSIRAACSSSTGTNRVLIEGAHRHEDGVHKTFA